MLIRVKVEAGAKRQSIRAIENGFEISVREPAERNQANRQVLGIMRARYPGRAVKLISGEHQSSKIIEIS